MDIFLSNSLEIPDIRPIYARLDPLSRGQSYCLQRSRVTPQNESYLDEVPSKTIDVLHRQIRNVNAAIADGHEIHDFKSCACIGLICPSSVPKRYPEATLLRKDIESSSLF